MNVLDGDGSIGLTEPAARAGGRDVKIFRTRFRPMRYALSKRDEHVMIKLVVDRETDRMLGVHMVGADVPEIIQAAAIADDGRHQGRLRSDVLTKRITVQRRFGYHDYRDRLS